MNLSLLNSFLPAFLIQIQRPPDLFRPHANEFIGLGRRQKYGHEKFFVSRRVAASLAGLQRGELSKFCGCSTGAAARVSRALDCDSWEHRLAIETGIKHGATKGGIDFHIESRRAIEAERDHLPGSSGVRCAVCVATGTVVGIFDRRDGQGAGAIL